MRASTIEVADVFRLHGKKLTERHKLPLQQLRAIHAIKSCRTQILGGHVDACDACGYQRISYNSCRNRHCPKCQFLAKERWIEKVNGHLLPIPYFHIVFTVPSELNDFSRYNQKLMYDLLFKASAETLKEVSANTKYLGATPGFISVLHTWGQNLSLHPHVHVIFMGGGLGIKDQRWVAAKPDYLFPVKVLSRLFRGKMLAHLRQALNNDQPEHAECLEEHLSLLYKKEWVVFTKPAFQNAEHVVKYLGRYTHRIAISNHRLVSITEEGVSFKWKDYRDGEKKTMMLDPVEFMRRFLLHVLPDKFVRIRYYGLLTNRYRNDRVEICRNGLGFHAARAEAKQHKEDWRQMLLRLTGCNVEQCPNCIEGRMRVQAKIPRQVRGPP
jgi:predicted Zn-ribbon and HTH transcriptional regulator